jgi:hypothetical protein
MAAESEDRSSILRAQFPPPLVNTHEVCDYVLLLFADLGFVTTAAYIPPSYEFGFYLGVSGALVSVGAAVASFSVRDRQRR